MTVIPSILLTLTTLFQHTALTLGKPEWTDLDKEPKRRLSPLHHHISLCENPADLAILGDLCTLEIRNFLEEHKYLFTHEVNVTFFDLEYAFRSVPHKLILQSLQRFNFPPKIKSTPSTQTRNLEFLLKTIAQMNSRSKEAFCRGTPSPQ